MTNPFSFSTSQGILNLGLTIAAAYLLYKAFK
jgi:hypothetical protein